jgi:hypothetical protein
MVLLNKFNAIGWVFGVMILSGCNQTLSINDDNLSETSAALFKISAVPNSPFSKLAKKASLTITASDMISMTRTLTITATGIEGTVAGIPSGKGRLFSVTVYDSLDSLQYTGSATSDLPRGATVNVPVNIKRVSTNAIINGTIFENDTNPLSNGLVACYPFNGSPRDMSGYLNDGVVNGAVLTTDRNGKAQSAYQFDGVNDYIEVPYSSTLDCENRISVTVWAKSDITGDKYADAGHVLQMGFGSEAAYTISLNPKIDRMQLYFCHHWRTIPNEASLTPIEAYNAQVVDGSVAAANGLDTSWHYYAFTFDGDSIRGYIDTVYLGSYKTIAGPIENGLPLRFGAQSKELARYWIGKIDAIRIYHRALSKEEVVSISKLDD